MTDLAFTVSTVASAIGAVALMIVFVNAKLPGFSVLECSPVARPSVTPNRT